MLGTPYMLGTLHALGVPNNRYTATHTVYHMVRGNPLLVPLGIRFFWGGGRIKALGETAVDLHTFFLDGDDGLHT